MIRLLTDENFDHRILRGLIRRVPHLNFVSVRDVGLAQLPDVVLLNWAANENKIILTHDRKTLIPDAEQLISRGEPMTGVILVPRNLPIGAAISDLELCVQCYSEEEMRNAIKYLPL